MFEQIASGAVLLLDPMIYVYVSFGLVIGIVIGALPGVSTILGVSLLLPISFGLEPMHGIPFLIGLYKGGIYGGSIPAILVGIPGTAASIATTFEGPHLTRTGRARKALETALYSSAVGDLVSDVVTILVLGPVATIVLLIGPPEVFAIIVFSLVLIASVSGGSGIKGAIAACIGLGLGFIGTDQATGLIRMTFGIGVLAGGIPLVPLVIGLFAVPEVLSAVENRAARFIDQRIDLKAAGGGLSLKELVALLPVILRSTLIGTGIGVVPGLGQSTAGIIGYSAAKRASKNREEYGKGTLEGIAAPEAANNAVNGPTLVPLLTLGIPGDAVTAILLGAFMVHGLRPGPRLLEESGSVVYALLLAIILANILFVGIGYVVLKPFVRLIRLKKAVLVPLIMALSVVGILSVGDVQEVVLALVIGVGAFWLRKAGFDLAPTIIAFILADPIEFTLSQSMLYARGDVLGYFFRARPIAAAFLAASFLWSIVIVVNRIRRRGKVSAAGRGDQR